jgi:hypothetical protein
MLWFPVINVDTQAVIQPLMAGTDIGSMLPVILLSIPDVWESRIVPFENIVSFTHTVTGQGAYTAELVFLDQTPIFAETLIRQYMIRKKTQSNYNNCVVRWGWRIQNPTETILPFLDSSGMLLTSSHTFTMVRASYKYSPYGVIISINFTADSVGKLDGFFMKSGTIDNTKMVDNFGFESEIARLINESVSNDKRFVVNLRGPNLANTQFLANLKDGKLQFDNNTTVKKFLEQVADKIVVPPNSKGSPFGKIQLYYPEAPTLLNGKETYVVIFYDKDNVPMELKNVPLIEYPAIETPIVGWNPTVDDEAQWAFLSTSKYKYLDADGNEIEQNAKPEANTVGIPASSSVQGTTKPVEASQGKILSVGRGQSIVATIDIDFFGDPFLSTYSLHSALFEILNSQIVQEGSLRITDDFFANFPGLNANLRKTLPIISEIPGNESPFNGFYTLNTMTHKIDAQSGYICSMQLYHQQDKV